MGWPGEVAFLLALFVLLGTLHGTRAQYEDYGLEDFDESDDDLFDYDDAYGGEEADLEEEFADDSRDTETDVDRDDWGSPPTAGAVELNQEFTPDCNNENCWIRVDWEPPPRDTWMSCLLGYRVGFRKHGDDWTWMNAEVFSLDASPYIDLRSDDLFFFEEAEGTNHSLTIRNLDFETTYEVIIEVFNPSGRTPREHWREVATPSEPCRDAFVPEPDKFVESSENSLSVHLDSWQDANCPTVFFMVEQRERGKEEWSSVSRSAKPGSDILISNLSPATWYQIKVTGEAQGERPLPDPTSLEFEIATLATDGSGFSGCVIEKNVKYSGSNLSSKRGINQETCALLCFKKPSCTHWTHNPTYQGGKCWLKTSSRGRTKSTKGSTSGQKACGSRGFSLPEVTKAAATAVAECQSPWTSADIPGQPSGCYLFHGLKSSWYDSKRECKQSGGHLVEIDSLEEQEALIGELERQGLMGYDAPVYGFWIGLTDIFHDGTWVWDHQGQPLNFSAWASGEPNNERGVQHCVAMNIRRERGKWDDVGCEYEGNNGEFDSNGHICEADTGSTSMTYTKETGKKWENENGKTSHMKVLMVHDEEECEKECTATVPCIAFTFIPGMEICALKAPKDAVTLVPGGLTISGRLDGERPSVRGKELDSTICLSCLPECNVEEGTKYSGYNVYPLGAETQEECAAACLREPECHFWTHNPNIGRCWLKKSDLGKGPSFRGSNSGQKSCGVTEEDILSGHVIEDGSCDCTSQTTEECSIEENTKYSGHNLYTTKGIKVGNMAGCASLCFNDNKCKFWTYNPRVSKCWMKTSDQGRSPSTTGSMSGQKACGAPGVLPDEPETLPTSGSLSSPNFPNDLHERKTIKVAEGNIINIHFTDFELESPDQVDYVDIIDGDGTSLGHFGARHYPNTLEFGRGDRGIRIPDLTSITDTVHVLFHTDETVTERGWRLEWSSAPKPPEEESKTNGVLTSPNFGLEDYPNDLNNKQTIQVEKGKAVKIHFTDFIVEASRDEDCDYVTITEGDGSLIATIRPNHPGFGVEDIPEDFISRTDTVHVLFRTDGSVTRRGWRLIWETVGGDGEETLSKFGVLTSPDYPQNYPSHHDSEQEIHVAEGNTISMHFTNFNTERQYDWVEINDGDGTLLTPKESGSWGGPEFIVSKTNRVLVRFHTDADTQRTGWRLEWTEREASVSGSQEVAAQEPYEAGRPIPGILMVGGKEGGRDGWPLESFPSLTCVDEIPRLGSGDNHMSFFTLSLIPGSPSTLVACGGNLVEETNSSRCFAWQHGQSEWRQYAMTQHIRLMGQAAVMADGSILLLGGQYELGCGHNEPGCTGWTDEQTVERVTPDGNSEVVFTLKHGDNKQGCALQPVPGGEVILLGGGGCYWCGGDHHAHVDRYDQTGYLGSLPDMLQPRFEHACGFFNDDYGNTVLMVAGGAVDRLTKDTKTATTELLLPGASSWIQGTPLPKAQGGVRGTTNLNIVVDRTGILVTG